MKTYLKPLKLKSPLCKKAIFELLSSLRSLYSKEFLFEDPLILFGLDLLKKK